MELIQITAPLLAWYDQNARVLAWRDDPSPYRVWLSEIMLQQTRVEAAKPYYDRFLQTLPTIQALAEAEEDTILKLWEGLGYYNRVRNMQKAARIVMEEYGGVLPKDYDALLKLPGIGVYSAGAIASIAYNQPVPAVDGNVLRVISRIKASYENISNPAVIKAMSAEIKEILPKRVGAFNQALMELGAVVCLPNGQPKCDICPVGHLCKGYQKGIMMELPIKDKKQQRKKEEKTVLLLVSGNEMALRKRADKGLLAKMWEYPWLEGKLSAAECREALEKNGILTEKMISAGSAKHVFTHIEWHMKGYLITVKEKSDCYQWFDRKQAEQQCAIPSAFSAFGKALETFFKMKQEK